MMPLPRSSALLVALVAAAACASEHPDGDERERIATADQAFVSESATLLDFELDGRLVADTNDAGELPMLIGAQLMYAVGQLNGHYSTPRFEGLELSAIAANASPGTSGRYDVTYHAKLPVAWGYPSPKDVMPKSYELILPSRAGAADQIAFWEKYGNSCIHPDAEARPADPAHLFIHYRPQNPECTPPEGDVVRLIATLTRSASNTNGKYPEYHRIWDDQALRVVVVFTRYDDVEKTGDGDHGLHARDELLGRVSAYLRALDPATTMTAEGPASSLRAALPDGRTIAVDVGLVGPRLASEGAAFDAWYNALTPEADLILFQGHADLGANIRALMNKGVFRAGKYVIWTVNGCDTFAYVDRTLANRRALLNPDDPTGTKYMDVVSNVLAGTFETTPATAMTLIDAVVQARDPASNAKTYRAIVEEIDHVQSVAVTGEEDNELEARGAGAVVSPTGPGAAGGATEPDAAGTEGGCSAAPGRVPASPGPPFAVAVLAILRIARARGSRGAGVPARG